MASDRDDFDPQFWGPLKWKVLYLDALSYPSQDPTLTDKTHYGMYYNSLQTTLPCHKCRDSVKLFLQQHPVEQYLDSKINLLKWVTILYNNKRPENSQIKNIADLRNVLDADETVNTLLNQIETDHPELKLF